MAISACRECGKEVGAGAVVCPHCGALGPTGGPALNGCLRVAVILICVPIALLALGALALIGLHMIETILHG